MREHSSVSSDASPLYAVIRLAVREPVFVDGSQATVGEGLSLDVSVKVALPTVEAAQAEVERLNALQEGTGVRYIWQYSEYVPEGARARSKRSAGSGMTRAPEELQCSFCGHIRPGGMRTTSDVAVSICPECIHFASELLVTDSEDADEPSEDVT